MNNLRPGASILRSYVCPEITIEINREREIMKNSTLLFGVLWTFILTGSGIMYGIDYNVADGIEILEKENISLLKELGNIENSLIWLQEEYRKNPYKGLSRILSTAYKSKENQTDSTPFINASGERVQDGTLALSRDMIRAENEMMRRMGYNPTVTIAYGDTVDLIYVKRMVVHDTMNKLYTNRADIWMDSVNDAKAWGVRDVYIVSTEMNN